MGAGGRYEVTHRAGRYLFKWPAEQVIAQVDQVKSHSDGRTTCRLKISVANPGRTVDLYFGQLNLAAVRSRTELAKTLEQRRELQHTSWDALLENLCREVLQREQSREPIMQLELNPEPPKEPEYIAKPLILAQSIQLWYGPGGSGKSLLAMYFAIIVHNGLVEWWPDVKRCNVLYLDWETDYDTAMRRANMLARPLIETGREIELPFYRRCVLPLADEVTDIALDVVDHDIGMVIVDSAGPACAGDIESADTALRFFNALRRICTENNASAKVLTHVTKAERRGTGRRLPIGSIYFENIPRMTWEVRKEDESDDNLLVGLFNVKTNECQKHRPLGFRFLFFPQGILVTPEHVEDVHDEERTQEQLVLEFLTDGAKTVKEISQYLEMSPNQVRMILTRLKNKSKVVKLDRYSWGLLAKD